MAQCAVRVCEICEHSPGKQYCINCEQYFCNNCKMSHLKAKVSKSHKFEEAEKVNPDVKIPRCEHHREDFSFFCDTCICLICQVCLTQTHKKHDFSLVSEAVLRKKTEVKSLIDYAEKDTTKLQTNVSILETELEKFLCHGKQVVNDIDSRRKEIIQMVNSVAEDFIARAEQHQAKESQRLKQKIEERKRAIREDMVIIEETKRTMGGPDGIMFLNTIVDMQNKLMSFKLSEISVNKLINVEFDRASVKDIVHLVGTLTIRDIQPMTGIKVGDRVKVKDSVDDAKYGWGDVTYLSIGTVVKIMNDSVRVDFPEHSDWEADIDELEHA